MTGANVFIEPKMFKQILNLVNTLHFGIDTLGDSVAYTPIENAVYNLIVDKLTELQAIPNLGKWNDCYCIAGITNYSMDAKYVILKLYTENGRYLKLHEFNIYPMQD